MNISAPDWVTSFTTLAKAHPWATAFGILFILVCIGVGLLIWIAGRNKDFMELVKAFVQTRGNETLRKERDSALAELQVTRDLVEEATSSGTIAKLALEVAEDTVKRFSRLRGGASPKEWDDAQTHLCDWIQRIFGFADSDINKVTVWSCRPNDQDHLTVLCCNGMSPEAAAQIRLKISSAPGQKDSFAVQAYRSRETMVCSDTATDQRFHKLREDHVHGYSSLIAIPVNIGGDVAAILTIDSLLMGRFDSKEAKQLGQVCAALVSLFVPTPLIAEPEPKALAPGHDV